MIFLIFLLTLNLTIQKNHPNVFQAFEEKESIVKEYFDQVDLPYPSEIEIYIFKQEKSLEIFSGDTLIKEYVITKYSSLCSLPEGDFYLVWFNSFSNYHLSLQISCPYDSLGYFIHGGQFSNGCVAITNDKIKEVYIIALMANKYCQNKIPIYIRK